MSNRNTLIIFLSIFLIFLFSFSYLFYQFNRPASNIAKEKNFVVSKGEGFREIAKRLESEGLIYSAKYFDLYLLLKGWANKLKPGIYKFSSIQPLKDIAFALYQGPIIKEVEVTIPEGYNIYQIDEILARKGVISKGDLINFKPSSALLNRFPFLAQKPREANLEGFLFPDTYRFSVTVNKNPEKVVIKFLDNFRDHISSQLKQQIEREGKSLYDVLILASLIEKEIPFSEDKPLVADILERRLKKGMRLRVDASVIYAKMLRDNIPWKEALPLRKEDFQINSLYNTYKYKGLPPTPICNPGLDSIRAVIYPQKNNYWYYLSDPKTKKTIFSASFLDHSLNIKKYLRE